MKLSALVLLSLLVGVLLLSLSLAQPTGDPGATTELSCNFGMEKGQADGNCRIAIPQHCVVAQFPGTDKPWSSVSKGGNIQCRFDDKGTDWKTKATGSCGKCKSVHCSARFSLMVRCG